MRFIATTAFGRQEAGADTVLLALAPGPSGVTDTPNSGPTRHTPIHAGPVLPGRRQKQHLADLTFFHREILCVSGELPSRVGA
jgi:hypothetical protein